MGEDKYQRRFRWPRAWMSAVRSVNWTIFLNVAWLS
jgi:hypothetical protein